MLFGAANIHLESLGVSGVTGYREHLYETKAGKIVWPSVNGPIPATWPATPSGITGFYTIYPNPDQLLAGSLDARLRGMIGSAPARGGVLTAYAEADGDYGKGGQFAPLGLTKTKLQRVHQHMQGLCRGSKVKYGVVSCGPGLSQVSFGCPGLDFYALDWYWAGSQKPMAVQVLNTWRRSVSQLQRSPVLAIAETNASDPAVRPAWFGMVYGWLAGYSAENGGNKALGYWSYWRTGDEAGSLSGPWLPGDTATIAALNEVSGHCGGDV